MARNLEKVKVCPIDKPERRKGAAKKSEVFS